MTTDTIGAFLDYLMDGKGEFTVKYQGDVTLVYYDGFIYEYGWVDHRFKRKYSESLAEKTNNNEKKKIK